jgi:Rab family protein
MDRTKQSEIFSDSRIDEEFGLETRYNQLYKIILIGDTNVGKTSIISKFLTGVFPLSSNAIPTIAAEFATKIIQIKEGGYIKAQIWDTAGQERYKSITYHHYRKSAGGLIVYDITKRSSFENISSWLNDLKQLADKECVIALIGNKLDIVQTDERKREVTKEEAQSFAYLNHLLFYETSAYNDENINDIFEEILQTIYNERRKIYSINRDNGDGKIKLNIKEQKYCYFQDNNDDSKCNC